jgi:hypothetical protein
VDARSVKPCAMEPSGRIETDFTRWPIAIHRTIGSPSSAEVDAFVQRADDILKRRQTHVVIFDSLLSDLPSPYMRQRSMDWMKRSSAELPKFCVGTVLVISSPAIRFVLSAVLLTKAHTTPLHVCSTIDEAIRWAEGRLAASQGRHSAFPQRL